MRHFDFKKRSLFSGPHYLGALLIMAGLIALISPLFFNRLSYTNRVFVLGGFAIIIGLMIISTYSGTLIDFTGKRRKAYWSIGGYKFGQWVDLPKIKIVKVISASYLSTNVPNGISPTLSGKVTEHRLLIYSGAAEPLLSFVYSNKKKALTHAKNLAFNLNAELDLNT